MELSVTILGARGSVPVSGAAFARYGGATTCVLVQAGKQFVVLDAGTGLLSLPREVLEQPSLPLLLTHPHADHLLGLPLCPYAMKKGARLDVYAAPRGGLDARAQVCRLMSPPLWPVEPEALPAEVCFHDLPQTLHFGPLVVDVMEGNHPGGVSLLRLEAGGKRIVFATDCTLNDELRLSLREFARDCDLLLCDGQYSNAEWDGRANFGHSSWGYAARFAQGCGVRRLRIIHHDPLRTDEVLDEAAGELHELDPDFDFAKEGECIRI